VKRGGNAGFAMTLWHGLKCLRFFPFNPVIVQDLSMAAVVLTRSRSQAQSDRAKIFLLKRAYWFAYQEAVVAFRGCRHQDLLRLLRGCGV
jgi:hypothetical protein